MEATRLLGNSVIGRTTSWLTRNRIRILAYHGVSDLTAFRRQLQVIAADYRPVAGKEVLRAGRTDKPLPSHAVWVTFDDGRPEVVTEAMALLDEAGITATMFVCPAMVDTTEPYWWEVVRAADRLGLIPAVWRKAALPLEHELKTMADPDRRRIVHALRSAVEAEQGSPLRQPQLTAAQVRVWLEHGHEVGNHSWDHPLLDQCSDDDQRQQIVQAHDWLTEHIGSHPAMFAYPNGNWTATTEDELQRLGYDLAVGFDHRLAKRRPDHHLRLSRLRVDTEAPLHRFRAIASGAHSTLLAAQRRTLDASGLARDPRVLPR